MVGQSSYDIYEGVGVKAPTKIIQFGIMIINPALQFYSLCSPDQQYATQKSLKGACTTKVFLPEFTTLYLFLFLMTVLCPMLAFQPRQIRDRLKGV